MIKSILIFLIFITSCSNGQEMKSIQKENRIELNIHPFGGGEIGYSIFVEKGNIITRIRELDIEGEDIILGKTLNQSSKQLTNGQVVSLNKNVVLVKSSKLRQNNNFALDTWIYSLKLNGEIILNFDSSVSHKQLNSVKELIKQLLKDSPIKIDLHHFS